MDTIGKRLQKLRAQKGMTLKELAESIGVPISTYKEWEYGRAIQGEPYEKLALSLGVTIEEIVTGRTPSGRITLLLEELQKLKSATEKIEKELLLLK